jgi:hypothetical protein
LAQLLRKGALEKQGVLKVMEFQNLQDQHLPFFWDSGNLLVDFLLLHLHLLKLEQTSPGAGHVKYSQGMVLPSSAHQKALCLHHFGLLVQH